MCSAPPISPGTHVSVDPPTFQWYVAIAGSCGPVQLGAGTQCPIVWQTPPPTFGSFPLTDTCFLMSNGQWNSFFSLNTQYCWGTHVVGGGLTWQTGGFPIIRLPAALPPVSLIFPSNADTQISITPRINWNIIDSANSYTLRVYSDACCIAVVFDSTSALSAMTVPLGRLSGNSRYYYRVKSYKAGGEGPFSDPFYFTTWTGQLPNLVSPSNNSAGVQLTPLLDWDDVLNVLEHRVQVSTDINFSSVIIDNSGIGVSQYNIPAGLLTYNSVYYWRAASRTASGWSPFSKGWNFRTYSMPDPVILAYPGNNTIEQPTSLTFRWYRASETLSKTASVSGLKGKLNRIDGINKYWFELTTDTVTMAGLITDVNITDTSKFISGLSLAKNYYWRVKANNDLGWGPFSNWWKFTTVIGPPQAPVLISPQHNSFQQFLNLPFIWNRSAEITAKPNNSYNNTIFNSKSVQQNADAISAYWFEITEDTVSYTGIIKDTSLTDTVKFLNLSVNSKAYFWRVKAKNETGWGFFSSWWKFITIPSEYGWSLAANINENFSGISFVDPWNGWICTSSNGKVLKTSNGGSNWNVIFQDPILTAQSICFTDQNNGQIASRGAGQWNYPMWNSYNGGNYWFGTLYMNYWSSNFVSVANTPEGVWMVGSMTTQGTYQTYPTIMTGGTEHLLTHNIGLNRVRGGKNNAWIVGGQGLIYRSLTQLNIGENVNLTGVSFNDNNTGYVVGENKIFKSTNNAASWFRVYPLTDQTTYNDVYFANKDTGWVACSLSGEGVIIGTTNGGASWALQYKGPYAGSEFTFVQNKYGWLLCGNSVLRTTNVAGQQNPPPVLLQPANGAIAQSLTPQLDWQDALNAIKYRVQLSADSLFTGTLIDDSSLTSSTYTVQSGLLQNYTQYYWRVAAKNSEFWSSFSDTWHFRTFGIPEQVALNYPLNNASNQLTDITFKWFAATQTLSRSKFVDKKPKLDLVPGINDKNDAINYYWFELTTDTNTFLNMVKDTLLTDTSKTVNGLYYSTSYYWRVKAHNEIGWGQFSSWWKFTTTNGDPVLETPVNNQTEVAVTPLLNWSDIPNFVKYRLQVSALSNFSVLWVDDSNLTNSQYQVIKGVLAYNSLYYWRVKTKNSAGWGDYQTPIRFFTMITPPPVEPVLLSPANGATGIALTPILDWNDLSGGTKYRVQISADTAFTSLITDDSTLLVSQYSVPAGLLNGNTKYYWRASTKGSSSWSAFSAPWNFTTAGVPLPVVLVFPPDNSTEQSVDQIFKWNKAVELLSKKLSKVTTDISSSKNSLAKGYTDAINAYWFEMTTDTNTLAGIIKDSTLTDTLKAVNALIVNTKYYWRVKAKNASGWGLFSLWWKFTTVSNLPPAPPALITPPNNSQNIAVTPLLDWNDAVGSTKYRLQVSALSSFSVLWIDDSNITNSQYQVLGGILAYNSAYYWRVKAKNSAGWGNYQTSPYRFFTYLSPPPAIPVLVLPANGATGVSLTPLLDWNDVSGITKYRLQIATDTGFTNKITDDSTIITSQYNVPAGLFANNVYYYWRVASKNTMYWSAFSTAFSFKTFGNPQNVILLSPANNSIEQPLNITFLWKKALETLDKPDIKIQLSGKANGNKLFGENDGTDAISKYWFELANDTVTLAGLIKDTTLTDTLKNVTSLTANTVYYWRAKAKNEVGWGPYSAWWKFTTVTGLPPSPPVLIYPANRAADIVVTPLLDWSDISGAQKYRVQVSAFSNFSTLWIDDSNSTVSEFQVPGGVLAYNSGYFWRVKAKNDAGWGNYQTVLFRFFTLVSPPQAPPSLVSPVNGAVNIPLTPLLDWSDISGALKYRVQVSTNSGFASLIIDDSNSVMSQFTTPSGILNYNSQYYWRASVKTGTIWSAFSGAWSFTTVTALSPPVLISPVNKDTGVVVTTLFNWSKVTGATSYRLQASAFSNFSVLWIDKYVTDSLYQTPNGVLAYNSRYFWRVKSLRAGDSSSYSNANYFFTKIFAYAADIPDFEEFKILDLRGLFTDVKKGNFSIQVCKDTMFENIIMNLENVKGDSVVLPITTLDEYSTYFWRVTSGNLKQGSSQTQVFVTYKTKQSELISLKQNSVIPENYSLYQNYPNPFNPVCRIKFDIPMTGNEKTDHVKLIIYDLLGREVAVLVNSELIPGVYEIQWNASNYPSGIYIYHIKTNLYSDTKKMVLIK